MYRMELRCFTVLISLIGFVGAKTYYMDSPAACGQKISVADETIIVEPRGVVGVPNPPIDCRISFESSSSSSNCRFEVVFERFLFNDCGMKLRLFDGLSVDGPCIKELDCSSTRPTDHLYSKGRAMTFQLTRTSTDYSYANDFSLRLSVFKDDTAPEKTIGRY